MGIISLLHGGFGDLIGRFNLDVITPLTDWVETIGG